MIYNSFNFIILFPFIFLLYYLIPAGWHKARNIFLLLVSYLLYINWNPVHSLVLFGVTIVAFFIGAALEKYQYRKHLIVCLGGASLVLPLLLFKYYNFITECVFAALTTIGLRFQLHGINLAIPVGLSFFTLQAVSYISDVYHKRIKPESDFLSFALYLSFFPSILSGPINRASMLLPQIKSVRPAFEYNKVVSGLKLILWGMFLKVVIADREGLYVDLIYNNFESYSQSSCLFASLMYSIQIYTDFAGYSLMALGVSRTLGVEIAENFRRPYLSASVNDFWKRWHISLSTWFKDYIYIPLGGNREGTIKTYRNILITFFVSGLWHGANFTYIIWGLTHAVWIIIERLLNRVTHFRNGLLSLLKVVITFLFVNFTWVLFRCASLSEAFRFYKKILGLYEPGGVHSISIIAVFLILFLILKEVKDEYYPNSVSFLNNKYIAVRWVSYITLLSLILIEGVLDTGQFIYAGF